nr:MAG TPA: hypothetical protein [Caudoviricetes sp.]
MRCRGEPSYSHANYIRFIQWCFGYFTRVQRNDCRATIVLCFQKGDCLPLILFFYILLLVIYLHYGFDY